jgi:hypothetical protein
MYPKSVNLGKRAEGHVSESYRKIGAAAHPGQREAGHKNRDGKQIPRLVSASYFAAREAIGLAIYRIF